MPPIPREKALLSSDGGVCPEDGAPLAFDPLLPKAVLSAVRELRARWPDSHTVVGLSNVSFNMPKRQLLNQTFLAMLLANGMKHTPSGGRVTLP